MIRAGIIHLAKDGLGWEDIMVKMDIPKTPKWRDYVRDIVLQKISKAA